MATDILVHPKHVNSCLFEDCLHLLVANDLTFVVRVLKVICFDVFPELLDNLRSRELELC